MNIPTIMRKHAAVAPLHLSAVEDRLGTYLPDSEEGPIREYLANQQRQTSQLMHPVRHGWAGAGLGGLIGAGIGGIGAAASRMGSGAAAVGAVGGGIVGMLIGAAGAASIREEMRNDIYEGATRRYLKSHQDYIPTYKEHQEKRRAEEFELQKHRDDMRQKDLNRAAAVGVAGTLAGTAKDIWGKQNEKTASLQKVAIPWAAAGKAISGVARQAWANPLARRALTGAAIGGGGNVVFGPSNQSVGRRFLTGATIGAAGGAAYHGATTRLGMPTATAMGNKARAYGGRQWGKIKNYFGSPATAPKSTPVSVRPKATRYGSGLYATGPQANLASRTNLREINFANKYNAARGTTTKIEVPKFKVKPAPKAAPTPPPAPAMPKETVPDFLKNNYGSTVTP